MADGQFALEWEEHAEKLKTLREAQDELFGGLDDRMLARFLNGTANAEESRQIEMVFDARPEVRERVLRLSGYISGHPDPREQELVTLADSAISKLLETIRAIPECITSDAAVADVPRREAILEEHRSGSKKGPVAVNAWGHLTSDKGQLAYCA